MSAAVSSARPTGIATGRLPRAALLAAVAAGAANAVVYYITVALGVDITGPFFGPGTPALPLSIVQVLILSIVPAIVAAVLLWLLARFTQRPVQIFVAIAVVILVLSFVTPFTLPLSTGLRISLEIMHVVAAVIITYVLVRETRAS
jgi:uncharacterized membrane protein